ncbi:MAG: arylsulfatase [Candidatus Cryptobacteroides sp.]
MKRNSITAILVAWLLTSAQLIMAGNKPKAHSTEVRQRPNILLICADDLGWSDIGCYGSEIRTPNIDALASQGVRMTQFHNTSKSFPSRSCLLTGLYAQQNGYFKDARGPLENGITLGEYLKSAGYTTLWSGKHHGFENPRDRGFDHFWGLRDGACNYFNPGCQRDGEGVPAQKVKNRYWCVEETTYAPYTPKEKDFYTTDYFTNHALEWLDECRDNENPFFLYLAFNAPHDPLMAWPEDIAAYEGVYDEGYEAIREARYERQLQMGLISQAFRLSEPTFRPWESLTEEEKKTESRKMTVYAAMIDRMDRNIGRVMDKLKEQGKFDNTLIIFVSDNGASNEVVELPDSYGEIGSMTNWTSLGVDWANVANTPLRYFKNYSYEGGISAPMVICWPDGLVNPGRVSGYLGHFIDFMPTFVELAGVPFPEEYGGRRILPCEGESFMSVIRDEDKERSGALFWEWRNGQAARDGRWKIVREGKDCPWELYDIQSDPSETNDIAADYPEQVERLAEMFRTWKKRVSITKAHPKVKKNL